MQAYHIRSRNIGRFLHLSAMFLRVDNYGQRGIGNAILMLMYTVGSILTREATCGMYLS